MQLKRRDWLAWLLGALAEVPLARAQGSASEAEAEASADAALDLDVTDLEVPGKVATRARLLVPKQPPSRLLILLHGRGEADSESLALSAWPKLYGLKDAVRRLQHPPVTPLLERPKIEPERLARINHELAQRAFAGLAIVCPVTPNPAKAAQRSKLFDDYSRWLFDELVPAVRARVPTLGERIGLNGCSMGGYVAWEVLLRQHAALAAFGSVQAAIGVERARSLARSVSALGVTLPIQIMTSSGDPFHDANRALSAALTRARIANDFDAPTGPHDQPWLRQIGTPLMLLWQDRKL